MISYSNYTYNLYKLSIDIDLPCIQLDSSKRLFCLASRDSAAESSRQQLVHWATRQLTDTRDAWGSPGNLNLIYASNERSRCVNPWCGSLYRNVSKGVKCLKTAWLADSSLRLRAASTTASTSIRTICRILHGRWLMGRCGANRWLMVEAVWAWHWSCRLAVASARFLNRRLKGHGWTLVKRNAGHFDGQIMQQSSWGSHFDAWKEMAAWIKEFGQDMTFTYIREKSTVINFCFVFSR